MTEKIWLRKYSWESIAEKKGWEKRLRKYGLENMAEKEWLRKYGWENIAEKVWLRRYSWENMVKKYGREDMAETNQLFSQIDTRM